MLAPVTIMVTKSVLGRVAGWKECELELNKQ